MQSAHETVPRRIDNDSHVTTPDYQVPGFWLQNTVEFLDPTIESAGVHIWVTHANTRIQCVDQV